MPKSARFAWASAVSLALHGLGIFWALPSHVLTVTPTKVVYISAITIPAVPATLQQSQRTTPSPSPSNTETIGTVPADVTAPVAAASPFLSKTPATTSSAASATPPPAEPVAPDPLVPTVDGYFPIDAVDQAAKPIGDWLVNPDPLPRLSATRIEVWLWISASGKIDRWELVPAAEPYDMILQALAELDQTPVIPALRNNLAVPSFRRLEIVVSRD